MAKREIVQQMNDNQYVIGTITVNPNNNYIVIGFSCRLDNNKDHFLTDKICFPVRQAIDEYSFLSDEALDKKFKTYTRKDFTDYQLNQIKDFANDIIRVYMNEAYKIFAANISGKDLIAAFRKLSSNFRYYSRINTLMYKYSKLNMFAELDKFTEFVKL